MLPGIGVFGSGIIARNIIPLLRNEGFTLEAIWSTNIHEAETVAKEFQVPFYTDKIDDMLLRKDVDLVFILCAPSLHAQISVKALGIGKHVVCDKPAGLNQAEALKMVRAAQYYPTLISLINHSLRFLPAFAHMKKAIDSGFLGDKRELSIMDIKVQMGSLLNKDYDWLCDDTMGGGTLTMVGSHFIDLVTFLTGQRALRAHGLLRTFTKTNDRVNGIRCITAPDFCTFQLEMDGGLLVTATLNNCSINQSFQQEVLLCGKLGQLSVKGGDLQGRLHKPDQESEDVTYLDGDDLDNPSIIPKPYVKGVNKMIGALREAFLPAKEQTGWMKEPVLAAATFEDGQYVQAVMEAIKKSSREKQWVDVTLLTEQPDPNPMLSAAVRRTNIS